MSILGGVGGSVGATPTGVIVFFWWLSRLLDFSFLNKTTLDTRQAL